MEICGQRYAHNGYATLPDTNSQFMGFQNIKTLILVLKEIINSFFAKELSQSRTFQKSTLHLRTFCSGVFFKTVQRIYDKKKGESYLHIGPPKTKTSARTIVISKSCSYVPVRADYNQGWPGAPPSAQPG